MLRFNLNHVPLVAITMTSIVLFSFFVSLISFEDLMPIYMYLHVPSDHILQASCSYLTSMIGYQDSCSNNSHYQQCLSMDKTDREMCVVIEKIISCCVDIVSKLSIIDKIFWSSWLAPQRQNKTSNKHIYCLFSVVCYAFIFLACVSWLMTGVNTTTWKINEEIKTYGVATNQKYANKSIHGAIKHNTISYHEWHCIRILLLTWNLPLDNETSAKICQLQTKPRAFFAAWSLSV